MQYNTLGIFFHTWEERRNVIALINETHLVRRALIFQYKAPNAAQQRVVTGVP